jgi:hypothetical protein
VVPALIDDRVRKVIGKSRPRHLKCLMGRSDMSQKIEVGAEIKWPAGLTQKSPVMRRIALSVRIRGIMMHKIAFCSKNHNSFAHVRSINHLKVAHTV